MIKSIKVTIEEYYNLLRMFIVFGLYCFISALSSGSCLILGCLGGPLSTVGLHCALVWKRATCVACAEAQIVLQCLSSSDVHRHWSVSPSEVSLSDM